MVRRRPAVTGPEGYLPTGSAGQSCAFCWSTEVPWIHPLDTELVSYRQFGKGHTLPHFWTLCDPCELLYRSGDDGAIVDVILGSERWRGTPPLDVDEEVRQPLAVFRRADRGARPLPR
jgi:hypothetical protein